MTRRLPLLPTLVVLVAVGIMVRLGFWQLSRLHEKEALLARYAASAANTGEVAWPGTAAESEASLYRRSHVDCAQVRSLASVSGRNASGTAGIAHVAQCRLADGGTARIVLGWSSDPANPAWAGGVVTGTIAPGPRLVADPPQAGLAANEKPDPAQIPNNHLSYAVQWFLFAGTALVIYALALRRRGSAAGVVDSAKRR